MAETKKLEATEPADTKTATATTPVEVPAAKAEAEAPAKKRPGRKPGSKNAKKPGRKPAAAKKATAAKTTTTRATKATVELQFAGKSYTTEKLIESAKDVWKYDMKKKVGDFKDVKLYVKPEEGKVYFVANGEEGEFII